MTMKSWKRYASLTSWSPEGSDLKTFVLLAQAMARAAEMGPLDEHLLGHPFAPNPTTGQQRR